MKWDSGQLSGIMMMAARAIYERRLFYLILLVLTLTAPAFAAHEQGPVGPYNVSFDMNTTENYTVIVEAPNRGTTSEGVNFTRHNLTVEGSDHFLFLILTRYDEPMLANITANANIVWSALLNSGADEPVVYQPLIDGQPGVLGQFRFAKQDLGGGQYEEGDLIVATSYSPDGKVYEDGVYWGKSDCRVVSTFPWEVIRDMLNSLHIEVPVE